LLAWRSAGSIARRVKLGSGLHRCIMEVSKEPSGRKPTFLLAACGIRPVQVVANETTKSSILSSITEIAERVGHPEGIEVVDVELAGGGNRRLLRIYIDKPGGVSHADCELVSQQVGTILDVEDLIPGSYTLEVSSPGVERRLKKAADFERFAGQSVKVQLNEPVENQRHWMGTLVGIDPGGVITLEATGGRETRQIQFRLDQVQKANLKFDW
jgi:ribosome maturation factor RimP